MYQNSNFSDKNLKMPFSMHCHIIQAFLRRNLTNFNCTSPLHQCIEERRTLLDILQRTATLGESNSVIIIGSRGTGKSALLDDVLKEISTKYDIDNMLLQVHLNGLLQTDDRIAIKEITRQLQLENTVGDRVFGSFADNLAYLLEALKSGNQHTKAIYFILDEFDLFCSHHNQTLLYNLFDIAQSAQTPVAVVGLSCRLDVLELLEKRVKSRFSHRSIHMHSKFNFEKYMKLCQELLTIPEDSQIQCDIQVVNEWNKNIQKLCKQTKVRDIIMKIFNLTKDIRSLKEFLFFPVSILSSSKPCISDTDFEEAYNYYSQDSKKLVMQGVSGLELCLLLAMKRLHEVYDGEPVNFEMVYKEYMKFAANRSSFLFEKHVVMKAFEHLKALEFVQYTDGNSSKVQKGYQLVNFMLEPSQVMTTLQQYHGLPTEVQQWASSVTA